jgi:hypothetical protein
LAFLPLSAAGVGWRAELQLMMVEQPGCIWCARWDEEIGLEYPLTDRRQVRALARACNCATPCRKASRWFRPPVFTPTFVLVQNGIETGRIEGYPGGHFFWPLLAGLIDSAAVN